MFVSKCFQKSTQPIFSCVRSISTSGQLNSNRTCLYNLHVGKGGKMVPFAGYMMPVQYDNLSISQSHLHTREHCSIFDVSHMLQTEIHGKDRVAMIESLVTGDIGKVRINQGTLTLFTNPEGGIIDDCIVNNTENHLYVVSNAGCRDKDIPLMQRTENEFIKQGKDVKLVLRNDLALIAVQGPKMTKALQPLVNVDLSKLYFMHSSTATVCGIKNCRITRCGYTGEDGVEISIPQDHVEKVVEALLDSKNAKVELAGLGARDSLRLEAGLCLYGNDMDETTTPVEATLAWLVAKSRRQRMDFPGARVIMEQLKDKTKVKRKRVGLVSKGPCPRTRMSIMDGEKKIGEVTSGCPSPTLENTNIMMGYVPLSHSAVGTEVMVQVRNKSFPAQVVKMPFVASKYYSPPKN